MITFKPGFVDSPMTAEFKKGLLWAKPLQVAKTIKRAIDNNKAVEMYVPFFWWGIMAIIKMIPEFIFRRISL